MKKQWPCPELLSLAGALDAAHAQCRACACGSSRRQQRVNLTYNYSKYSLYAQGSRSLTQCGRVPNYFPYVWGKKFLNRVDIYRIGACGVIIAILLKRSHSNQRKRRVWIREWIIFLRVVKERSIFIKFDQFDCFLRCPRVGHFATGASTIHT